MRHAALLRAPHVVVPPTHAQLPTYAVALRLVAAETETAYHHPKLSLLLHTQRHVKLQPFRLIIPAMQVLHTTYHLVSLMCADVTALVGMVASR